MDPAEDSFNVSPMHTEKYPAKKADAQDDLNDRQVEKDPTSGILLSGVSAFDYLGSETAENPEQDENKKGEEKNSTKKSLEKDFIEAEQVNDDEGYSPVVEPNFDEAENTEIPNFTINPVATYEKRPRQSYMPRVHSHLRQRPNAPWQEPVEFDPRDLRQGEYKDFLLRKMEYRVNR